MKPLVSMRAALGDLDLLGVVMGGSSRFAWRAVLIAALGEALTPEEGEVFFRLTGRFEAPLEMIEELFAIVGRRGGKSSAIAALVVYLGALCDHSANLSVGERGVVLVLASNAKQAGVVFGYVAGILESIPALAALVTNKTSEVISLANGIDIEIRAASFRGIRGITAVAVIADEIGYWFSDETSRNPDSEILSAIRPALATTGGPLIAIGSPYAKRGELWKTFKKDYGANGDPKILVVKGTSRDLNPTLPQKVVDRALERDEASARAEYLAEFRSDVENFVSLEAIEACVSSGVTVRPPLAGVTYSAFVDPSGGTSDSMTLAIGHRERRRTAAAADVLIVDCVLEKKAPFNPDGATWEFAQTLKEYRVSTVRGDRYGGEWPTERFSAHGIKYEPAEMNRSELYLAFLPLVNAGRVDLPDSQRLISQFVGLERKTSRGGRDSIDHAPGGHDDIANAVAGVCSLIGDHRGEAMNITPEILAELTAGSLALMRQQERWERQQWETL